MGIRFFLTTLFALFISLGAQADGVHFPLVGYPKLPEIPRQCALITYKDGVETLVVESSYKTDSPAVQWILPVPSNPDKIDVADKDMLTSVLMSQSPKVIHDLSKVINNTIVLLAIGGIVCWMIISADKDTRLITQVGGFLLCILLLGSCLLSTLGTAGGITASSSDVTLLSSSQVGNYEVKVLQPSGADELALWLKDNGFAPLPQSADAIVKDYIQHQWVFLTARLTSDETGLRTPHPISVQFKTPQAVFPMRLTSLAKTTTRVDLFVVSDLQAKAKGFNTMLADRYVQDTAFPRKPDFHSQTVGLTLGNPDAVTFLWKDCILTHLQADLAPEKMTDDVNLAFRDLSPTRATFFSPQGRKQATQLALLGGLLLPMTIITLACRRKRKPTKKYLIATVVFALVGLAIVPFVRYAHGVIPVTQGRGGDLVRLQSHIRSFVDVIDEPPASLEEVSHEFHQWIEKESIQNPYTHQPLKESKIPGDYQLRQKDNQVEVILYSANGSENIFYSIPLKKSRH